MKTFSNKKTSKLFYEIYQTLSASRQSKFGAEVRSLFEMKVTSDKTSGDFYVSKNDLLTIAKKYV